MGEHAQTSHTAISVLGIEGATCAMEALSSCAAITSGTVNILHPLEMVRQIRLISQNPILATEVSTCSPPHFSDVAVGSWQQLSDLYVKPIFFPAGRDNVHPPPGS